MTFFFEPILEVFHKHRSWNEKKAFYSGTNYGTLGIDWDRRTMEVAIHNADSGEVVLSTGPRQFDQQKQQFLFWPGM